MSRQTEIGEWFQEYQDVYVINKHTAQEELPKRNYRDTWHCEYCHRCGEIGVRFKSTLRTRVRGHQNCRCNQ